MFIHSDIKNKFEYRHFKSNYVQHHFVKLAIHFTGPFDNFRYADYNYWIRKEGIRCSPEEWVLMQIQSDGYIKSDSIYYPYDSIKSVQFEIKTVTPIWIHYERNLYRVDYSQDEYEALLNIQEEKFRKFPELKG